MRGVRRGALASIPLGIASVVLGAGFGVAARQAGLPVWASLLMSGSVYAGAAQFAVLPLWSASLPMVPIWFSTFAVNARFMLLSASLAPWLMRYRGATPWATVFLLGEGPWAVGMQAQAKGDRDLGVVVGSGLVVWIVWLAGTAAGFLAAPSLGDPRRFGLDLVLVLFFAATHDVGVARATRSRAVGRGRAGDAHSRVDGCAGMASARRRRDRRGRGSVA